MIRFAFFVFSLCLLFTAGCATQVRVRTDPEGADIMSRGSGRTAYQWEYQGRSPAEFTVYYTAIQTVAKWPDGRTSPVTRTKLRGKKEIDLLLKPAQEHESNPIQKER